MTIHNTAIPVSMSGGPEERLVPSTVAVSCGRASASCLVWFLLTVTCWFFLPRNSTDAANFVCADPEFVRQAEQARRRSATFWSGRPLPGDWSYPCPILIHPAQHAGGGVTSFTFQNGEVFGWRMTLEGTREVLLNDILPHEVDHMVRASLVRHPIARWLDEGCASLMESATVHERLRRDALRISPEQITEQWLAAREYPTDNQETTLLYAAGFSLVEFLLDRDGPAVLLAFQQDQQTLPERLRAHYRLDVHELRLQWAGWRKRNSSNGTDCHQVACPIHAGSSHPSGCHGINTQKETLVIWTATWCPPCHQFWWDWHHDPEFRRRLTGRFQIHVVDFDRHRSLAVERGIVSLPTFEWPGGRLMEYPGKRALLVHMGVGSTPTVKPSSTGRNDQIETPATLPLPAPKPPSTISPDTTTPPSPSKPPPAPPSGSSSPDTMGGAADNEARQWAASRTLLTFIISAIEALPELGLIGGTLATGGAGGAVMSVFWLLRRWRRRRRSPPADAFPEGRDAAAAIPFPRRLDEARQLLGLRQSEGRVAVLDALRGMFLDDELDKLARTSDADTAAIVQQLRERIDARVDEVAPLSTQV